MLPIPEFSGARGGGHHRGSSHKGEPHQEPRLKAIASLFQSRLFWVGPGPSNLYIVSSELLGD